MNENLNVERVLQNSKELNMMYIDNLATKNQDSESFKKEMKTKFDYLFTNFEPIFNICLSQNYDFNRLKFMLQMAKRVQKSEITEHDASVQVGQILVDQIVKPQLDKAGVKPDKKK